MMALDAAIALVELPAAWPVALSVASVLAGGRMRRLRRRARLNRGLHELRRPLQALALERQAGPRSQPLELALAALSDLDEEINDGRASVRRRPVACRAMVESAIERWRGPAARAECAITLSWRAGDATVLADPTRIARALDNLLANAIEHGGLQVRIGVDLRARGVRIAIANGVAPSDSGVRSLTLPGDGARRDHHRGHGLAIISEIAAEHDGRFALRRDPGGALAVLELPLASPSSSPTA